MEAILKFNLPEDQYEFDMACKGSVMHTILWDMDQWLRGKIKYAPADQTEEAYRVYEETREQLRELMLQYDVKLDV